MSEATVETMPNPALPEVRRMRARWLMLGLVFCRDDYQLSGSHQHVGRCTGITTPITIGIIVQRTGVLPGPLAFARSSP